MQPLIGRGGARSPSPNDRPMDPRAAGFDSPQNPDNYRFAPAKVFVDAFGRVMEAMAGGVDPLPAYKALKSAMDGLGRGDAEYEADIRTVDARVQVMFDTVGHMDRLTYVEWYMTPMWSLALRKKVIRLEPATTARPVAIRTRAEEPPSGGASS